jgi:hypothetical protein
VQPRATRVAVTTRDGVSVNERLHRALDLHVFERRGDEVAFVERRARPASRAKVDRDYSSLEKLLADCAWVVTLGLNGEARRELAARGFRLLETRGPIDEVIRKLPLESPSSRPS